MPVTANASNTLAAPAPPDVPVQQSPTPDQIPMQPQPQASQPQAPAVPASVSPAQAELVHHSIMGRAVQALVHAAHGNETSYQVNPQTGAMEQTVTKAPASTFFKNLVLGALIGGAVGTANKGQGGFAGGFTSGGAAAAQAIQGRAAAQDLQRRAQAQTEFNNQGTARKRTEDETLHLAQVSHINALITGLHQHYFQLSQEEVDKKNAASRAYQKSLVDAGASPVKLSIDGNPLDTVSADKFAAAVVKDPTLLNAPDGSARHFVDTTDLSELHFDGGQWVDDSGNPVNMSASTSIKAYDLPTNTFKKPSQVSGKLINQARGAKIVDDDRTYSVTPEGMSALYTLNLKDQNERARTKHQQALADKHADNAKKFGAIEVKKATALAKAEHTYWTSLNSGKVDQEKAGEQLQFEKQQAQGLYEDEIRAAGGTPTHFEYGKAPATQPQPKAQPTPPKVQPGQSVTLKNGKTVTVKSLNPNGTFNY
jgi:hypothetical protein